MLEVSWRLTQENMTVLMDGCIIDHGLSSLWESMAQQHIHFPWEKASKYCMRSTTNTCLLTSTRRPSNCPETVHYEKNGFDHSSVSEWDCQDGGDEEQTQSCFSSLLGCVAMTTSQLTMSASGCVCSSSSSSSSLQYRWRWWWWKNALLIIKKSQIR